MIEFIKEYKESGGVINPEEMFVIFREYAIGRSWYDSYESLINILI